MIPDFATLLHDLKHGDSVARENAAMALRQSDDPEAIEPLIEALKDENWSVRQHAVWALSKLAGARAVELLIGMLHDPAHLVRFDATRLLGDLGDNRAVEPLLEVLQDEDELLRIQAAWALGKLGDRRAVESLLSKIWVEAYQVRASVVQALGDIGDPHTLAPLLEVLKTATERSQHDFEETVVRRCTLRALSKMPRHLLTASRLSPQEHIPLLEAMRHIPLKRGDKEYFTPLPTLDRFCRQHLDDEEQAVQEGAKAVLDYLTLGRPSQRQSGREAETLLRPAAGSSEPVETETLLRPSDGPDSG